MTLFIERTYQEKATPSNITFRNGREVVLECKGLELPWLDNQRQISCIPEGYYKVVRRTSPRFGEHFHILDVPNRSFILIHHGNYTRDIQGCLLVGREHRDIDGDGIVDVTASVATMNKLRKELPDEFMAVFYKKGTDPAKHIF